MLIKNWTLHLDQVTPIHRGFHALLILVIAAFARYQSKLLQFSAMARIHSIIVSGVALLTTLLSSSGVQAADDQALPWDGTFQDLTVDTLTDKYLTHILTNRQNGTVGPDQWATITQKGRSPPSTAIRASPRLPWILRPFSAADQFPSLRARAGRRGEYGRYHLLPCESDEGGGLHQLVLVASRLPRVAPFEIRIDASVDPVQLVWYTGGSTETRWSTEFKTETWYNFGIAVSSGELALYFSEGDDALALTKTETYNGDLTLSNDGSAVKMAEGKQDVLSFNGVTVENSIPSGLGSTASSSTSSSTSSESTSTSASTPAPVATTATPTVTTAAPSTETSEDDAATTEAPAATTAAPPATEAPSTSTADQNSDTDTPATNDAPRPALLAAKSNEPSAADICVKSPSLFVLKMDTCPRRGRGDPLKLGARRRYWRRPPYAVFNVETKVAEAEKCQMLENTGPHGKELTSIERAVLAAVQCSEVLLAMTLRRQIIHHTTLQQ
ncbi:hypothetical protein GQ600_8403 [Phytophthora cactorum]|nr:hypothetical protein GQ600_8403 [Phytophthora cactorum]